METTSHTSNIWKILLERGLTKEILRREWKFISYFLAGKSEMMNKRYQIAVLYLEKALTDCMGDEDHEDEEEWEREKGSNSIVERVRIRETLLKAISKNKKKLIVERKGRIKPLQFERYISEEKFDNESEGRCGIWNELGGTGTGTGTEIGTRTGTGPGSIKVIPLSGIDYAEFGLNNRIKYINGVFDLPDKKSSLDRRGELGLNSNIGLDIPSKQEDPTSHYIWLIGVSTAAAAALGVVAILSLRWNRN